ncbi:hypothetical protein [Mesorhizobium sp. B2-3-5]|uniref:hypothetical protein n=1 Tax=Mesorhizobium sp. B2-3-5 TaxID=2589958 RepID=UPI0011272B43|nr:hypothetical protein [Mesorhizobium sp. B2-3-5]TPM31784.1 hypothetical protein FJ958_12830 [Mesorhizobium sp. B2-3-5]
MAERNAINVLIKLLGGEAMTAELEKLGSKGEKAIDSIQDAAKRAEFGGFRHDIYLLIGDIGTFATRSVIALGTLKAAADGIGAALFFLAKSGAEAAVQANNAAQAAGLSAKAYQEWQFAAESVGVSQSQLGTALSSFNKQIIRTADETSKAGRAGAQMGRDIQQGVGYSIETFKDLDVQVTRFGESTKGAGDKAKAGAAKAKTGFDDLGISVENSDGTLKTNEQLLLEVADAFKKLPDGAFKSAVAVKLLGIEGAKLIPLLNQGAAGADELKKHFDELGIGFSDDQIKAAVAFDDALTDLKKTAGGVARQIGLIFVPSFTAGANAFRDTILRNKAAILDFANIALAKGKQLVADFFAALSGRDADVSASGKWIVEWRDAIVGFGNDAVHVINGVVIPAFDLLRKSAGLVTEAINKVFGTSLTGGELLILTSITQILGGFQVLRTAIFNTINALSLFSRALLANPWLAVLTVVAGGIAIWATRTDEATAALRVHDDLIGKVGNAYDEAGRKVAAMTQQMKDQALIALRNNRPALADSLTNEVENAKAALQLFDQQLPFAGDAIDALNKQVETGKIGWAEYAKQIAALGAAHPELGALAQELIDTTKPVVDLSNKLGEADDWTKTLSGSMTDAQFAAAQAARGIAGYGAAAQKAGNDAAAGLDKSGAAADGAKGRVEALGQTITVFRGGGPGGQLSKEVFDVVDGVARRADQSKAALDGVAASGQSAADKLKNVSTEVTNSVQAVPDAIRPDAAAAAVDGIVGDVGKIAPAAQDAASGVSDALGSIDASGAAAAAEAFAAPFTSLPGQISTIISGIQSLVQGGFANLAATVSSLASQIRSEIAQIISALQAAVAQAQQLRAQASSYSSSSSGGGSQGGFAVGGHVVGAGGPTTDSILARLSNGEFVIQARAVQQFGVDFFNMLNHGIMPSLRGLRGFSIGGFVDNFTQSMAIPAYAGGGLAKIEHNLT